ncbi:MAG: sugar ABC transporter permease, partial [Anaerolineae bacterium]|nr:sugar ABC transporter permease [Anaerolineae bacterium]
YGVQNYINVLSEGLNVPNYSFFPILGFNILWTFVNVFFHVAIGIAVAMALNTKDLIGKRLYRTLFVIPWGMPILISGLIWNNMWQRNDGGINLLAEKINTTFGTGLATNTDWLGEVTSPIDIRGAVPWIIIIGCGLVAFFLARDLLRNGFRTRTGRLKMDSVVFKGGILILTALSAIATILDVIGGSTSTSILIKLFDRAGAPVLSFYAVLATNIWLGWPFMMVVATGALQSIPPDLFEAADVDGASKLEQFRQITVPLIRPAMIPAIMLGTIWTFNQFNVIRFITNGGPRGQTEILVTQAYKLVAEEQLYGAAAAFSFVVFFVLLVITLINNRVTRATEAFDE